MTAEEDFEAWWFEARHYYDLPRYEAWEIYEVGFDAGMSEANRERSEP